MYVTFIGSRDGAQDKESVPMFSRLRLASPIPRCLVLRVLCIPQIFPRPGLGYYRYVLSDCQRSRPMGAGPKRRCIDSN